MASARCVYCDATLQPNSMYCVSCGQLIPQEPARPPVPAQFSTPREVTQAQVPQTAPAASSVSVAPVPLPRSLPWQQAGASASPQPPATAAAAPTVERVELAFASGQRAVVSGSVVIGRKPTDTALAMGARAVEVQDDTRSVSRVHLFLEVVDGVIMIGDAGSANGSRLEHAGRIAELESAGTRVVAAIGDTVWIGDLAFAVRSAD